MPGIHIENFGCRAARADGDAIGGRLRALSEHRPLAADIVVVNTCSVTAEADRAARAYIRRAHRLNPAAKIVVTGCYAQRAPQELSSLPGVSAVVGNSYKALVPEIAISLLEPVATQVAASPELVSGLVQIRAAQAASAPPQRVVGLRDPSAAQAASAPPQVVWADDRFAHSFLEDVPLEPGVQTRPNLKIQEGCGNRCTFCVIPLTRGPSRSLSHVVVLRQVEGFVTSGGKELVLSGINLGRWGQDFSGPERDSLTLLVRAILEQTALPRLRLSSIEPMDWDTELIAMMGEFGGSRLARHSHLPLQSGSDAVLRRMHRRYRPWHYAGKIAALIRAAGPDLTIGADVIAGFPGETDREFEETLAFLRALPLGYLHLFPFSPRPATPGWALHASSPVPQSVVDERMGALRALAAEKTLAHRSRFIGRTLPAITLHTPSSLTALGRTPALSENFLPIELEGRFPANEMLTVRVTGLNRAMQLTSRAVADQNP
jgi:threonylcarbamoyladenosine tRNA methylthiotransferase MtaB